MEHECFKIGKSDDCWYIDNNNRLIHEVNGNPPQQMKADSQIHTKFSPSPIDGHLSITMEIYANGTVKKVSDKDGPEMIIYTASTGLQEAVKFNKANNTIEVDKNNPTLRWNQHEIFDASGKFLSGFESRNGINTKLTMESRAREGQTAAEYFERNKR